MLPQTFRNSENTTVVYLEGLPCWGKISLIQSIAAQFPGVVSAVPGYLDPYAAEDASANDTQAYILLNDELKNRKVRTSSFATCLLDRRHLSKMLNYLARMKFANAHDSGFVTDWYFHKILPRWMLPDRYIYLALEPVLSMARRSRPLEANNLWDHMEALHFAADHYLHFMGTYESDVPVLVFKSSDTPFDQMEIETLRYHNL